MNVTYIPCNAGNYGGARSLSAIKWIVIHYTGTEASARNNGVFFKNTVRETSCHYFVDSKDVVQSVQDNYVAWHCGTKGRYYHPEARNSNSIGIELCDDKYDGTIYPTQVTIDNALALTREIMARYNVPADHVIRHWDVTHKLCPAYWCGDAKKDALWKSEFLDKLVKEESDMETRYNTLAEIERDCPWAAPTVAKLIRQQTILGDGSGLDLSRDMLRLLVINDRAGCYDN